MESKVVSHSMKTVSVSKTTFLFINSLQFALALGNICTGIWLLVDPNFRETTIHIPLNNYIVSVCLFISSGVLIAVLSPFGCFAFVNEFNVLTIIYLVFLLFVLTLQIATAALASSYGFTEKSQEYFQKQLNIHILKKQFDIDSRQFIDNLQTNYLCCGGQDFEDYVRLSMTIPFSCHSKEMLFYERNGCAAELRKPFLLRTGIVFGFTSLTFIVDCISVFSAILVMYDIRRVDMVVDV